MRGALALALVLVVACGSNGIVDPDGGGGDAGVTPPGTCPPCGTNDDCAGGACGQLGGDLFCAPSCGGADLCPTGRTCATVRDFAGRDVRLCVAQESACGLPPDAGAPSDAGGVPLGDGGGPVTAKLGPNGGTMSRLLFASVGDTRPALPEDTKGYPTQTITTIFQTMAKLDPMPPMAVSSGDYLFSLLGTTAAAQLKLYQTAQQTFPGAFYPAMGNHECTFTTTSNCGPGTANGVTTQYTQYMQLMMGPLQKTQPYYAIDVDAEDMSWTSKFVFIAANAWDSAQAAWLPTALAKKTTYTFIIRHEASSVTAPGVQPSNPIIAQYPYTLLIVGHTHTYDRLGQREVMFGNGGAPLSGGKGYGFGLFSQRKDGAIQVDAVDWKTGLADPQFRFAVKPDGSPAP